MDAGPDIYSAANRGPEISDTGPKTRRAAGPKVGEVIQPSHDVGGQFPRRHLKAVPDRDIRRRHEDLRCSGCGSFLDAPRVDPSSGRVARKCADCNSWHRACGARAAV